MWYELHNFPFCLTRRSRGQREDLLRNIHKNSNNYRVSITECSMRRNVGRKTFYI